MITHKKLVLLNPAHVGLAGLSGNSQQRHPPLALACIAGLTPDDWEIVLEDELWAPAEFHADATLVGATSFTSTAPRAYDLLAPYRAAGIPTILGGIHAWACEAEARTHAGSVVIQEAERVWWQVLTHARCGLSARYEGGHAGWFAPPRYELLDKRYEFSVVQFSRGCPMHCTFCSVPGFSGRTMRRKLFADVCEDLAAVPQQKLFIADDNLYGHSAADRRQATELLAAIAAENFDKRFVCQASLDAARDDEFLDAAQAAGVRLILIGIEAADEATLKAVGKSVNLQAGRVDFSRVHAHGMGVLGAYVFGFDTDTPASLRARARFMVECGADCSQMTIATPLPGTPFYRDLKRRGRLLYTDYPRDWARYDFSQLVYLPAGFRSMGEFYDVMCECAAIAYNDQALKAMAKRTAETTGSWETAGWAYQCNNGYAALTRLRAEWWGQHRSSTERIV
jgi:radical SAM superfamily enzyme YgiQ (UPF0313 family)